LQHAFAGTLRASEDRSEFLDFAPTLFFGVPAMYVRMLDIPAEQASARSVASMRLFVSGSAALPPQIFDEFREVRPHHSGALRHERNAHEYQ
jgi:acyl-CoA synthetase (AMP-forming)/AMP-acid ligase II